MYSLFKDKSLSTEKSASVLVSLTASVLLASSFAACGSDSDDNDDAFRSRTFVATVRNVSMPGTISSDRAGGAVPLSPGAYAVYTGSNPAFNEGELADQGTELIAEDGFPMTKADSLAGAADVSDSGIFASPGGMLGDAFEPGASGTFTFTARPGDRLTLETMFVQSNDWFYALEGLSLFDADGNPISGDITGNIELYDAGTEQDSAPGTGEFQKPVQGENQTDFGPAEEVPVSLVSSRHGFAVPATTSVIQITIAPQ